MNLQTVKLAAALFLLGSAMAHSQTLNWGSLTGSDIVDSRGDPLDNTYIFQLGAFDAGFAPDDTNIGTWGDYWHSFDTASYSHDPLNGGYFTGTRNLQDELAYSSLFEGMTAYMWIRNNTLTEHFLATSTAKPGIAEWKFPALDPGCCPNGEVTTWSVSNFGTDTPIWGSQRDRDGGGEFEAPGPFDIQTHVVPEPNSALLLLAALGYTLTRRRRCNAI